jgi:hypothetical protein
MKLKGNQSAVMFLFAMIVIVLLFGMMYSMSSSSSREGLINPNLWDCSKPIKLDKSHKNANKAGLNNYYFTGETINEAGKKCLITYDNKDYHYRKADACKNVRGYLQNNKTANPKNYKLHPNYYNKDGSLNRRAEYCLANVEFPAAPNVYISPLQRLTPLP